MSSRAVEYLLARNGTAVAKFVNTARGVPPARWTQQLAPHEWTPAQHAGHLVLSYQAMTRDLRGEGLLALIGTRRQRFIWRLFGLSQVLVAGRIPHGAPSPRELLPADASPDRITTLDSLQQRVAEFDTAIRHASNTAPRHRLTHPYFGRLSLIQAIRLAEAHTLHHATLLRQF